MHADHAQPVSRHRYCVEVALSDARLTVHVRDSKNPTGPTLTHPAPAWATCVAQVGGGRD
ncbi:DUF397 domain-containing protein [Streptomyces sp. NPDC002324]